MNGPSKYRPSLKKLSTFLRIYFMNSKLLLYSWLVIFQALGVSSKQVNAKTRIPLTVLQKNTFALSKISGLSVGVPSSSLDGLNFVVEPASTRNVTTQVGQTTYLHCIVDRTEDQTVGSQQRQVSWIRLRDFHLLTVGSYTYTSDSRFMTIYNGYSSDWTLQIKYPQPADEGVYECQISSDPPVSHYVNLKVLVPKAQILGGPNFYVGVGSELNLTCVISDCPEAPAFVFWYHDGRMINYDRSRGDITIQKAGEDTAVSRLHIQNAQPQDSGNYSCCPSNTDAASIFVHVLKGEKHAAVQNDATSTSRSAPVTTSMHIVTLIIALLFLYFCFNHSRTSPTR